MPKSKKRMTRSRRGQSRLGGTPPGPHARPPQDVRAVPASVGTPSEPASEIGGERGGVRVSGSRVLLQSLQADRFEFAGDAGWCSLGRVGGSERILRANSASVVPSNGGFSVINS